MTGTRFGVGKDTKKPAVHPLCSRKRPLSKIIASPTYQEQLKKGKKEKERLSINPKIDYLTKKRTDNLLKKKNGNNSSKENSYESLKTPKDHPLGNSQHNLLKKSIIKSTSKIPLKTPLDRRCTLLKDKENCCNISDIASPSYTSTIRKSQAKERRLTTFAKWKPKEKEDESIYMESFAASPKIVLSKKEIDVMTPWRNTKMSMRDRLELWLAAKNCSKTPTPASKRNFKNSPHPNRRSKSISNLKKLDDENSREVCEASPICISTKENGSAIAKDLEIIVEKFEKQIPREEIESDLDDMISKYTTIVKFADYWICKARLASLDNDVKRVICLLEQAHTFQAQPGEKIKEEICRYLELLEAEEKKGKVNKDEEKERLATLYAITPGRKVHFAAVHSPLDFKSSMIRFCLLESKAFKRRLNEQLKRKVLTPVRRSIRVERSELPDFLRTDKRVVGSPGEVEEDIIDGEVSFVPNKSINTPLNKGWLIQDETETKTNSGDGKMKIEKDSVRKVNFKEESEDADDVICTVEGNSSPEDIEKTLNTTFDIEKEIISSSEHEEVLVSVVKEECLMDNSDVIPEELLELSFM